MHAATVALWPVDVALALSGAVSTRGAGQRFRHHSDAMDIRRIAGTAAGSSVVPRSAGCIARHVSGVMPIPSLPGGVSGQLPPSANASGLVAMRRTALGVATPSRRPAVPA